MATTITVKIRPRFPAAEYRIYRSLEPFDESSLPDVLATLSGSEDEYFDDVSTLGDGIKVYYCVAADNSESPAATVYTFTNTTTLPPS